MVSVGSGVNNTVNAVISFNNELYAAGKFTTAGATDVNHIARWNGTLWQLAGAGLDSDVTALAVYNNELYAEENFFLPEEILFPTSQNGMVFLVRYKRWHQWRCECACCI